MVNRNGKWFLALGVAAVMTANGLAMAAVTPDTQTAAGEKQVVSKKDVKHNRGHIDNKELLALLKIDAKTFKSEMKAGKSLVAIAKDHGVSEQSLKDFMIKQMMQRIEAGVKSGKLTSEQAEKMKTNLDQRVSRMINGTVPMHRGFRPGHHKMDNSALLTLLKIDQETFRSELKAGKTLAAIAKDHGVSEQTLKNFMIQKMTLRIETAVQAGKITADQAEQRKANIEKRVNNMINRTAPMHKGHHHKMDNSALLTLLNIDKDTLRQELKSGKTLAAIAQERGVSEQALKDTLMSQMTKRIEAAEKAGKLSADKAKEIKANMEQRITDRINGKGPMHKQ